jgi:hypothetical protein
MKRVAIHAVRLISMPDDAVPPLGEIVLYQTEDGQTRVVPFRG